MTRASSLETRRPCDNMRRLAHKVRNRWERTRPHVEDEFPDECDHARRNPSKSSCKGMVSTASVRRKSGQSLLIIALLIVCCQPCEKVVKRLSPQANFTGQCRMIPQYNVNLNA